MTKLISRIAPKRSGLLELSRDVLARTAEGKEALIAMRAIRDWKASAAIRRAHGDLASYFDTLAELHAAGKLKLKGESFMSSDPKQDGSEYGLALYRKWEAAGRPGTFKAFIESERTGEKPDAPTKPADDTAERDRLARMRGLGR